MASVTVQSPSRSVVRLPSFAGSTLLWLSAVTLLGLVVRFYGLGGQSLWADEIAAVEIAKQPLRVLWSTWMVRETNPPLYYSLLHLWMPLAGQGAFAVRSLSALIGAAAVPLMYALGRQIADKRVGLIAALLTALWSHQLFYSQEARGYIFGAVGVMLAVIGLLRISDCTQAKRNETLSWPARLWPWLAYAAGSLIAVYTHTTHVLFPILANLYFAWLWAFRSPRRVSVLLAWTAANAAVVGVWAWWGWITWLQVHLVQPNFGWIGRPSLSQGVSMVLNVYGPAGVTLTKSLLRTVLLGVGGVFIAAAAFGLTRLRLERAVMLAVFAIGAPLLLFVISQKTPIMLPRTLLWAQFSVILGLASALAAVRSGALRLGLVTATLALLVIGWTVQAPKEPWRNLVTELAERAGPADVVLVSSVSDGVYVQHYCAEVRCRFQTADLASPTDDQNRWVDGLFKGEVVQPAELPALIAHAHSIWTVSRWADDPRPAMARVDQLMADRFATPMPDFMAVERWVGGR